MLAPCRFSTSVTVSTARAMGRRNVSGSCGPPSASTSAATTETVFLTSGRATSAGRERCDRLLLGPKLERRILEEHRPLQPLQRPAGLEPELFHEHLARLVVDAKRLGLAA